ncbi:MAG: hypothetical protein LBE85_10340, partial [Candidatus Accumulibacter sp.]|nr:hypothetical protein [Accumulibacter sp.]
FGVDPDFNDCIDGLVLVDISLLKPTRYRRYIEPHLGAEGERRKDGIEPTMALPLEITADALC